MAGWTSNGCARGVGHGVVRPAGAAAFVMAGLLAASHAIAADPVFDPPPEVRLAVPATSVDVVGTHALTIDGEPLTLRAEALDEREIIGIVVFDGSEVFVTGARTTRGVRRRLVVSGRSRIDGADDASLALTLDFSPGSIRGKGTLLRPADGVSLRGATVAGVWRAGPDAPGGGPSVADLMLEPVIRVVADDAGRLTGDVWITTPQGVAGALPLTGTAKRGRKADAYRMRATGGGSTITVKGTWDGGTFRGTATGRVRGSAGPYDFRGRKFEYTADPDAPPAISLVSPGETDIALDAAGRVGGDTTVGGGGSGELFVEAGTRLRAPTGELLTGMVRIGLRPLAAAPGPDAPVAGLVRPVGAAEVFVERGGTRVEGAVFDPPARLRLDFLGAAPGDRIWDLRAALRGARGRRPYAAGTTAKPAPRLPSNPYGPVGGWRTASEQLEWEIGQAERLALFAERRAGAAGVPGDEITEIEIPGDDTSEYPRVKNFRVVQYSPGTGYENLLGITTAPSGTDGLTVGESVADVTGDYAFSVVGRGGKRYVQCRTRFRNRLRLRADYCLEGGGDGTTEGVADPSPPVESPDEGPFDGAVTIFVEGWGGFEEASDFTDGLGDLFDADVSVRRRSLDADLGGRWEGEFQLVGHERSVGSIAAALPPRYEIAAQEGRILFLRETCPDPLVVALSTATSTLHTLTLSPLEETGEVALPGTPFGLVVGPGSRNAWMRAGADTLVRVDPLRRRIVTRRTIAGLTGSVGIDPLARFVYVTTNTGTFAALDPRTLETIWEIPGLPAAGHTRISPSLDGGRAWLGVPSLAQIPRVDLLSRSLLTPFTRPAQSVQTIQISHGGDRLAVADLNGGRIVVLDAETGTELGAAATGQFPIHVRWGGDDSFVATANQGSGSLSIVDTTTFAVTQVNSLPAAEGVETHRLADGTDIIVTGSFSAPNVTVLRKAGLTLTPQTLPSTFSASFFDIFGH